MRVQIRRLISAFQKDLSIGATVVVVAVVVVGGGVCYCFTLTLEERVWLELCTHLVLFRFSSKCGADWGVAWHVWQEVLHTLVADSCPEAAVCKESTWGNCLETCSREGSSPTLLASF